MGVHSGVFKSQTLISSLLPGIRPVFATGITVVHFLRLRHNRFCFQLSFSDEIRSVSGFSYVALHRSSALSRRGLRIERHISAKAT